MDIGRAIKIHDLCFGHSEHFSNPEVWKHRKLHKIYFNSERSPRVSFRSSPKPGTGFLAVEKYNTPHGQFHIWLMGSLKPGGGKLLFKQMAQDLLREDIMKITVSTFPEKFKVMYEWLLRIGFKVHSKTIIDGKEKVHLEIGAHDFLEYARTLRACL